MQTQCNGGLWQHAWLRQTNSLLFYLLLLSLVARLCVVVRGRCRGRRELTEERGRWLWVPCVQMRVCIINVQELLHWHIKRSKERKMPLNRPLPLSHVFLQWNTSRTKRTVIRGHGTHIRYHRVLERAASVRRSADNAGTLLHFIRSVSMKQPHPCFSILQKFAMLRGCRSL